MPTQHDPLGGNSGFGFTSGPASQFSPDMYRRPSSQRARPEQVERGMEHLPVTPVDRQS